MLQAMKLLHAFFLLGMSGISLFAQLPATNDASPVQRPAMRRVASQAEDGRLRLQPALTLYAHLTGRTVLQHPALKPAGLSLGDSNDKAAQIAALEQSFRQNGIATILDGEKFVMFVPEGLTNTVKPRSSEIASGRSV